MQIGDVANLNPFAIQRWDNPESVRFRKYLTGSNLLLHLSDVETGRSPKKLVWARDKVRLYQYESRQKRYRIPVLVVYAVILRSYILDLTPRTSLIRYLIEDGFDVFLLDFDVPDKTDQDLDFDTYIETYVTAAVEQTITESRAEDVTVLGHCMGGTFAAIYAATDPPIPPKNLVFLAAPIDFTPDPPGLSGLGTLLTRQRIFAADSIPPTVNLLREVFLLAERGLDVGLSLLRETALTTALGRTIDSNPGLEDWLAVCKWVDDGIPYLGRPFRQWLRQFYEENRLVRGEFELGRQKADLASITCPVLNIAGLKDAITPIAQTRATTELISSSDKQFFVLDAGHLGMIIGPAGRHEMWPGLVSWLASRSG